MLRKIFLLATVLALAALLARGHSTFSTSLAADAPQQSATEKDNSAQLERALKTEAEHHKLESLVYEHDSLASHWPTWAEHYRPPRLFDKAAAELQAVRKRLATEINYKILEDRDWIAYYLLRAKMVEEAESIQQCRERTESVSTVAPTAQLIYELRSKLYDPEDKERVAKADEIASIPEKIEAAKAKIKDSKPRDLDLCMGWLERDARALEEWGKLHSATVPEFGKTYGASITKAIDAMKAYREWLDKNRDKWPKGEDKRLGEEKFAETLRKSELECRSPKELDEMARAQMKSLKAEMEELAKKIDKDKTAWQLLDEMKAQHPEAGLIAPTYARLLERARDFVVKKDIVSVPKDWLNNVRVERFIDKDRFMPYAFYNADGESSHYFMSSEPTEGMKPQERDDKLQGHNYYSMFTVTVHETFPGHHLQFAHAAGDHHVPHVDSYSAFFSEGWGLYCEQLMYEQGFYEKAEQPKGWDFDPLKIRLSQLRWRLHRAARVVIDIEYQTQNMSYDDAVKLMVNEAGIEEGNAKAEVNRFTKMPTQPMSYLVGYLDIMKLREDYKKMKGDKFSLKEFHDELLSYGSVPPILVRAVMLGERDKVDEMLQKN